MRTVTSRRWVTLRPVWTTGSRSGGVHWCRSSDAAPERGSGFDRSSGTRCRRTSQPAVQHKRDGRPVWRMLLGRARPVPTRQRCHRGEVRLRRRRRATAIYAAVSSGHTGHAESVRITYDPNQVTYGQLLRIFFAVVHDPTQLDRQGPDDGSQYRSVIFIPGPDAAANRRVLSRSAGQAPVFFPARSSRVWRRRLRVLPRRAVSPGLHELESLEPIHLDQRHAQAARSQAAIPGALPRPAGADARQRIEVGRPART